MEERSLPRNPLKTMDRAREKVFWTRRRTAGSLFALFLVPLTIYATATALSSSTLKVDPRKLLISTVERGPFQEFTPVTGHVLPIRTIYLETTAGGRVEEIFLEEGSIVPVGSKILRLANTDLQLDTFRREDQLFEQINLLINARLLMEKQARDFAQTTAQLDFQILKQRRVQQRDSALFAEKLISSLEYELSQDEYNFLLKERERALAREQEDKKFREAQIRQMEGAVERARKNLVIAQQNLDDMIIEAPISGQLTALDAEIGQAKAPGDRLAQIDVIDGFKARADIDQHFLPRVDVGQTGEFDLSGSTYKLKITKVYSEVTEGKFEIDLEFIGEEPPGIKRGQNLQIRLALGDLAEVIYLKKGAFFQKTGGQWIYVVDEANESAIKRRIRLGRQNPDSFEVLAGLEPGERAITSSYENLGEVEKLIFIK